MATVKSKPVPDKRHGGRRGDGGGADRQRAGCGAARAGLKDDRGGAVGARCQAAGAGVLRDAEGRGGRQRDRGDGVARRVGDGDRLRRAGLARATTGNVSCVGFVARPAVSCPEPFSGTETGATPEVDEETTSVAAMAPVAAGVKTICAVQLVPLLSKAPQVVEGME